MNKYEQLENPNIEDLSKITQYLVSEAENNGVGVVSYVYRTDMIDGLITCFYGRKVYNELQKIGGL